MGVIDGQQQAPSTVLEQRGSGRTQQRRRVANPGYVDQVAKGAERDLAGRCGARKPLNRDAAVPLSKPIDGVASKHRFAHSSRAGQHCAEPILAFQRRLQ
jgi:hypothetical protein